MNANQSVKPQSSITGNMMSYTWRDEKNGRCFFQIATRREMPLKEMIQRTVVKQDLQKMNATWYIINCDASETGISYFKEKTPIRIWGHFNATEKPEGIAYDFVVEKAEEAEAEILSMIEYLVTFPGISYADAETILNNHGTDVFRMAQSPGIINRLVAETKLPETIIQNLCKSIKETTVERELFELTRDCGMSYALCAKAVKVYEEKAIQQIKKLPYLCGRKLEIPFFVCDRLGKKFGIPPAAHQRIQYAGLKATEMLCANGNTFFKLDRFYDSVHFLLEHGSYPEKVPVAMVTSALASDYKKGMDEEKGVIDPVKLAAAEKRVAKNIFRLASNPEEVTTFSTSLISYAEKACEKTYGTQQKEAFSTVLRSNGVKIVTGGPGTGKTSTILGILLVYMKLHPEHKIRLCAPTGRAAQRMAESTGMEAVTVHRLLDFRPFGSSLICKDAANPIDADLIVVDEMSMMNIELFDLFLEAVKTGTTLILVGDINQLEAVGPGAVLQDLLEAPDTLIPRTMLTEVFRQKGGSPIIENAMRINSGLSDLVACQEFQTIHTKSEEESLEEIRKIMIQLYDPKNPFSSQILCPARKGLTGIQNLNVYLQELLNPTKKGFQYGSIKYRLNDKILFTRNNYSILPKESGGEMGLYNGDIGVIKEINGEGLLVEVRNLHFQITRDLMDDLCLSYGMTIHKSQGSEFETAIVVMPAEPKNMLVRNLLYTAVTRAKKNVIIIDESSAAEVAIRVSRKGKRDTRLSGYLKGTTIIKD